MQETIFDVGDCFRVDLYKASHLTPFLSFLAVVFKQFLLLVDLTENQSTRTDEPVREICELKEQSGAGKMH